MNEKFLSGRTALVTGGASGMGRAVALALADAGANIAIGSLLEQDPHRKESGEIVFTPDQKSLEETKVAIEAYGVKVFATNLDVCLMESAESFVDRTIEMFGQVDVLVNAAGMTCEQTVVGHSEALWEKVMDVNATGTFRMIKLCLPKMIEAKWGRIINIASTAASVGAPTSAAYCASKAAVVALSRCVALEGAPHGVTCNTISPGWVETSFGKKWMTEFGEEYIQDAKDGNPQNRLIQPDEVGALAHYLCRNKAAGMTMQDLTLSAGSLW